MQLLSYLGYWCQCFEVGQGWVFSPEQVGIWPARGIVRATHSVHWAMGWQCSPWQDSGYVWLFGRCGFIYICSGLLLKEIIVPRVASLSTAWRSQVCCFLYYPHSQRAKASPISIPEAEEWLRCSFCSTEAPGHSYRILQPNYTGCVQLYRQCC